MAIPVIASESLDDSGGSTATSLTLNKPVGTVQGDYILVMAGDDRNNTTSAGYDLLTGGSTWLEHWDESHANVDCSTVCQGKIAGASEPSTYTLNFAAGENAAEMWAWTGRLTGVDGTTPVDVVGTPEREASSNPDHSGITTTVDDCLIVAAFSFDGGDAHPSSVAGPFTEQAELSSGTGNQDASGGIATKEQATAGATGACTWTTDSSDGNWGCMLAIAGAAGGSTTLVADSGSYTWTGQDATLLTDRLISAESGSYSWSGQDAGLLTDHLIPAESGSYAWSGQDASLITDRLISAESGSYAWSGQDAELIKSTVLTAESGSYNWTGQDATLSVSFVLDAESGSYAWSGQDAGLLTDHLLSAESGSYNWTGQDANLAKTFLISAESGSYSWSGQDATLLYDQVISALSGSYAWSGQDASLLRDLLLTADPGSYTWSGQDADLITSITLIAESGSYTWSGQDAALVRALLLAADPGTFLWSGQDATLTVTSVGGGPDCFEYLSAPVDGSNVPLIARIEDVHFMRAVIRDDDLILKSHMDDNDIVKKAVICDDS